MTLVIAEFAALALIVVGAAALLLKLFWPKLQSAADGEDLWAQHNERDMPSLERQAEARDSSIDAAVASQIVGD